MKINVVCTVCHEIWNEKEIFAATGGNEDEVIECVSCQLCPDCIVTSRDGDYQYQ